ncbi:hypothetical protein VPH35_122964 [Triticum aestivum]|uniref:Uncharacterized protein n=1 Tax=Triticum urartu TaxID=4572 RepID=A0A8R7R4D7_TRIUA
MLVANKALRCSFIVRGLGSFPVQRRTSEVPESNSDVSSTLWIARSYPCAGDNGFKKAPVLLLLKQTVRLPELLEEHLTKPVLPSLFFFVFFVCILLFVLICMVLN